MFIERGKQLRVLRRGGFAWLVTGCFVAMGLVFGAGLSDPQFGWKVFGTVMAAICFGYAYVMWRAATVVFYSKGALVGTPLRPQWIKWDQMIDVSLQRDRSGYGRRGHVPVIQLKSGRYVRLGFFFAPDGSSSESNVAARVATALRAQLGPAS